MSKVVNIKVQPKNCTGCQYKMVDPKNIAGIKCLAPSGNCVR